MRGLKRNKQELWFALYVDKDEILDEYGNRTGQYTLNYGDPKRIYANISPASGETSIAQFGENERYDKVLVFAGTEIPIDEYSILWIDAKPKLNRDGTLKKDSAGELITPHNYIVKRVAKSLNSTAYAVNKVSVSG